MYIKRNQESGFGFRVLGGEGPDQPVGSSSSRLQPGLTGSYDPKLFDSEEHRSDTKLMNI